MMGVKCKLLIDKVCFETTFEGVKGGGKSDGRLF